VVITKYSLTFPIFRDILLFLAFWWPMRGTWGPQTNICQFVCVVGRLCKQKEFCSTCIIENIVWMTNLEMYLDAQTMNPTHFCPIQGFSSTEICQFWIKCFGTLLRLPPPALCPMSQLWSMVSPKVPTILMTPYSYPMGHHRHSFVSKNGEKWLKNMFLMMLINIIYYSRHKYAVWANEWCSDIIWYHPSCLLHSWTDIVTL
jgi:hypothetical protein